MFVLYCRHLLNIPHSHHQPTLSRDMGTRGGSEEGRDSCSARGAAGTRPDVTRAAECCGATSCCSPQSTSTKITSSQGILVRMRKVAICAMNQVLMIYSACHPTLARRFFYPSSQLRHAPSCHAQLRFLNAELKQDVDDMQSKDH